MLRGEFKYPLFASSCEAKFIVSSQLYVINLTITVRNSSSDTSQSISFFTSSLNRTCIKYNTTHCSTLHGRIKGAARSIFSIMRYGRQYSKARDNYSLLPRPHPLINLQLPREGLVTLATKTVASTSQNREVASRLQRANPSRHYCLTYNVTVLIRKFTKPAQVLLLHIYLFHSIVACLSSTRMLFVRLQTGENEQTMAYVRVTVL